MKEIIFKKENNKLAQYFNVNLEGDFKENEKFFIKNIDKTQYPNGWKDYSIFFSIDGKKWGRVKKSWLENNTYYSEIFLNKKVDKIFLAWYQPYLSRNLEYFLMNYNYKIDKKFPILKFNEEKEKTIVMLARQHPGEIMSSFFLEGVIDKILKNDESLNYKIIIFPMINLSGVENEKHRFSVDNFDYNRSWDNNNIFEIKEIKKKLKNEKIELVLDIHGDEVSKINFARKNKNKKQNVFINLMNKKLDNFLALDYIPIWKRFLKKILGKSPAKISGLSAEEYFNKQKIPAITLELSAKNNPEFHRKNGEKFIELFLK